MRHIFFFMFACNLLCIYIFTVLCLSYNITSYNLSQPRHNRDEYISVIDLQGNCRKYIFKEMKTLECAKIVLIS